MNTLEGRTVLITGANRGLGEALLQAALDRGAATVYTGTRTPYRHEDPRVTPLALDLREPGSIAAAAADVARLDVLINNAGLGSVGEDLTDAALLADHLDVNVIGPLALTNALVPALARAHGRIVSIGSIAALANLPVMPSYSISKAAALSLAQAQRGLLARHGIRVQIVIAGPIDTEMSRQLAIPKASPAEVAAAILDGVDRGVEEIFPDPLSASVADAWDTGLIKSLERANAALLPAPDYSTSFVVERPPADLFAAISDPRGWWDGDVVGTADTVGSEFSYRHDDDHFSIQRVVELEPDARITWEVVKSELGFVDVLEPWTGTRIVFELEPVEEGGTRLTFTHHGLVPALDCYDACAAGWDHVIDRSLRQFVETGRGLAF